MTNPHLQAFERLKNNQFEVANTTYKQRIRKLNKLQKAITTTYKSSIREAMMADFGKPVLETDLSDIYPVVDEIKNAKKNLRYWMKDRRVKTPLALLGSQSYIKYEPKGVCLIMSPWNYPVTLTLCPLVSAIAAGNCVVVKPSEISTAASSVMQTLLEDVFDSDEVVLVQGGVETAEQLLELPFNHIFFTGSPSVGKIIMKSAAAHLSSVTLELGGKSPVIVDDTVNLSEAAEKIAFGKFLNTGQTCIAPDYALVDRKILYELITELKNTIIKYYGENQENSQSYGRIISRKHFSRLLEITQDARDKGAEIVQLSKVNPNSNFFPPTLIYNISDNMRVMQEEIFGPILPIRVYENLDDAIDFINRNERPLALYIYSKSNKSIKRILNNTRAGGTTINHNLLHFLNINLPFGGINNSGIGKSHGYHGYKEFSNERAVLKQFSFGAVSLIKPPYTNFKRKLIDLMIKYF